MLLGHLDIYMQKKEVGPLPHTIYKNIFKNLNARATTIKLLEKDIGANLHDLGFDSGFLDMTPKGQVTKEKTDILDFIRIKNFCASK